MDIPLDNELNLREVHHIDCVFKYNHRWTSIWLFSYMVRLQKKSYLKIRLPKINSNLPLSRDNVNHSWGWFHTVFIFPLFNKSIQHMAMRQNIFLRGQHKGHRLWWLHIALFSQYLFISDHVCQQVNTFIILT